MSAGARREPRRMVVQLILTIVGALLMVGPSFALGILDLSSRFQRTIVMAAGLVALVAGLILLLLAFKGQEPTS